MEWRDRIAVKSAVRTGKPCIKGTRITVYDVLEYLAGGMTEDAILSDFPDLTRDDIRAALAFAAAPRTPLGQLGDVMLLLDENVSHRLVSLLAHEFPGSVHGRRQPCSS